MMPGERGVILSEAAMYTIIQQQEDYRRALIQGGQLIDEALCDDEECVGCYPLRLWIGSIFHWLEDTKNAGVKVDNEDAGAVDS